MTDKWATPQGLYDKLNKVFSFTLDACADETNHKCEKYYTEEDDGLKQSWGGVQGMVQSAIRQADRKVDTESRHCYTVWVPLCGDAAPS